MCRKTNEDLEFFLVHPGGPFFSKKNEGAWSIPKGNPENNEELLAAAIREFSEETGIVPVPPYHSLGSVTQKGGKIVFAWTFLGTWNDADGITSNHIHLEWPPRSGKQILIPEVDKAEWMTWTKASVMINPKQLPFLERALAVYRSVDIP